MRNLLQRLQKLLKNRVFKTNEIYDPSHVLKSFNDINNYTKYSSGKHLERTWDLTKTLYKAKNDSFLPSPLLFKNHSNLFALLASLLSGQKKINILDIGGGMGIGYTAIRAQSKNLALTYYVVDLKEVISFIRAHNFYDHDQDIHFMESLEDLPDVTFDLIYMGSSLQYFADYKAMIQRFCSFAAPYIFLDETLFIKDSTFATLQTNVADKRVRMWIFNFDEIIKIFKSCKYNLIYNSANYDYTDTQRTLRSGNVLFKKEDA